MDKSSSASPPGLLAGVLPAGCASTDRMWADWAAPYDGGVTPGLAERSDRFGGGPNYALKSFADGSVGARGVALDVPGPPEDSINAR
jgi:hypothetical protein